MANKVGEKQIPARSNDHDYNKSNIDNRNVQRIIITITESALCQRRELLVAVPLVPKLKML